MELWTVQGSEYEQLSYSLTLHIESHHHHHHRRPNLVGLGKVEDLEKNDPKFAALQKKASALKEEIEEAEDPKELTEEEEKEKFEKETLPKMELDGKKVNNAN